MKLKFISVLTALAIIFSLMPAAFAVETEPLFNDWTEAAEAAVQGTDYTQSGTAYTIKTAKGLAWFANKINAQSTTVSVVLENDIDLSNTVRQGASWIPIANEKKQFSGTFDGQGHTVKGLVIESGEEQKNYGLFGTIGLSGVVKNVKTEGKISLMGTEYNGENYSPIDHSYGGAVAGENQGIIQNCENAADISGTYIGGIAGVNRGVIENSSNSGNVTGYEEIGGITGLNIQNYYNNNKPASILNCNNTGSIAGCEEVGGIAGRTSTASISNSSNSGKVTGQTKLGGITGDGDGAVIDSCENSGTVEVKYDKAARSSVCQSIGGIVGHIANIYGTSWKIQYCHNTGTVICKRNDTVNRGYDIGGIAGGVSAGFSSNTGIFDCVNDGKIDTASRDVGGVIGRSCGGEGDRVPFTANCVNNGEVIGVEEVGGIVGETTATIVNSYNTGNISASYQNVGGIVGKTSNYSTDYSKGKVQNCYNIGEVSANKNAGSVVGYRYYGTVENCYYPQGQKASGMGSVTNCAEFNADGILLNGMPLVDKLNENVKTLSNNSWGFWIASQNPPAVFTADVFLSWNDAGNAAEEGADYTIEGDTYTVFTPLGLAFIANTVNGGNTLQGKTVVLNNDIDLSGVVNDTDLNDKNSWNPIGYNKIKQPNSRITCFDGTFDGQNHTVSGMKINRETAGQGLFGEIFIHGEVKNLGVINSSITVNDSFSSGTIEFSGLIAANNSGNIRHCYTGENTSISSNGYYAGGIVGINECYYEDAVLEDCLNMADVSTKNGFAGGIVACNSNTRLLKNCTNKGTINSENSFAGGIAGEHSSASNIEPVMINCSNEGEVISSGFGAGGITGVIFSYNKRVYLINCYNTAAITSSSDAGGICGDCRNKSDILNCYNSGRITSAKTGVGSILGSLSNQETNVENCYYLSSSASKPIGYSTSAYTPVSCNMFNDNGTLVDTDKSLCDALNDGVHLLNNNDAFTWTKGEGFAEFDEPILEALTVEALKLTKSPAASYIQGQTFNPAGMIITLLYSNGSQADVTYSEENADEFTFTPSLDTALAVTDTDITVEYSGKSVLVPITVHEKNVTSINVLSLPDKTTYLEGQELDLTGMTVTALYDNGDSEAIIKYDVTGYDKNKVGNQNITVSFGGFTASFIVTVKAKTVTGIKILSEPNKKEFKEGTAIDVSGLVLQAQYDNGTTALITDYTVNGYDKNTIGTQTITISYGGFDATFDVEVTEKTLTGITLDTANMKMSYIEGQLLNVSGLIVKAQYDNGTEQTVARSDYNVSGYSRNQKGIQTVIVEYQGFKAQFDVEVVDKTLTGLKILLLPPKRDYIEGEELDTSGLVLWAKYDNGTGQNVIGKVTGYDKNKIGTQLISAEYGGFTVEFTVTVTAKSLTELTVSHKPFNTEYIEGQDLNLNGLTVTAKYNNGTSAEVTDYTVSGYDKDTIGTQTVTVSHGGMTASFDVKVEAKCIAGIKITKLPNRTNYVEGQDLNLDGMELTVYYNNGTTELADNYTVTGYDKNIVGEKMITVEYEGKIAKFIATVTDKQIANIEITSEPTKTSYIEGQDLELAGLIVKAEYNDGTTSNVTGYDIIGYDKNKTGEQTVTVEYAGQTAQFTVNVEAKVLENIMIIRLPFKTDYIEEQELDLTGICVIANYNNGVSEEINDYSVSMFDNTAYGMQTIVLTYQDKTATFALTVAQKQMTQLAITSMPQQITYVKGQELDLTGMTVTASYDNGKIEAIEDYEVTGFDNTLTGRQTVIIQYGSMSDSFNIMVADDTPRINASATLDTAQNTAQITAAPANCGAGVVVAALYKDDVLIAVKKVEYNGTDAPEALSIPYTVEPNKIKVVLWDSLEGMKPICNAETPTGYTK